jgi:hypothetical protein
MFKLLFVILALFLIMLAISKCKFTESFANTPVAITSDNVADYIYTVYKADVKAIQNLADIAMKLQAGGVTVPGNMTILNQLNVANATVLNQTLEVKGTTTLGSSLKVVGDINGPYIEALVKRIEALEGKVPKLEADIDRYSLSSLKSVSYGDVINIGWGGNNFYVADAWKIKIHGGAEEGPYGDKFVLSKVT